MILNKVLLRIGLNTGVQTLGRIISIGLSLITVFVLTRYLGVEGYGKYSLVFAYLAFFAFFADFGLQTSLINILNKSKDKNTTIGTFFWIKSSLVFLSTLTAIFFLFFMPYSEEVKKLILVGSLGVGLGGMFGFSNTLFQKDLKLELITFVDIATKIVSVALILLFVFYNLNLFFIVSSIFFSNLVGLFFSFILLNKYSTFSFTFDKIVAKEVIRLSAPIGLTAFLSIIYFRVDTILLSVLKGASEVGIYSLSYKIFENLYVFWWFYLASFYPLLSKFYHTSQFIKYKKLMRNSLFMAVLFSLLIIVIGNIFAPLLIRIIGGENFSDSITPFRILIFTTLPLLVNTLFYYYFLIKEKLKLLAISLVISLLFNIVLNLILIPKYSYIGTSFATLATEMLLVFIYFSFLVFYKGSLDIRKIIR